MTIISQFLDNQGLDYFKSKILEKTVPTSRTVNGKALSSNITLMASDVGALPSTGGSLSGNLVIKGPGNYGTAINLGDGDYVHISEPTDDCMEIKAKKVNIVTSDTTSTGLTWNGNSIAGGGGQVFTLAHMLGPEQFRKR